MPRCSRCGFEIPEDEDARFCPNCGAPIRAAFQPPAYRERGLEEAEAVRVGPLKISVSKRLTFMAIFFAVSFASTFAGALSSMDLSDAQMIIRETEELRDIILKTPGIGIATIFGNNLIYCLLMFVPALGLIQGIYVLYSTGRVLAALGLVYGSNPLYLLFVTFIFPHAIMEYIAYSIALSEGFWLTYVTVRQGLRAAKHELNNTAKAVAISTVILLLAAIIEMYMILAQI